MDNMLTANKKNKHTLGFYLFSIITASAT